MERFLNAEPIRKPESCQNHLFNKINITSKNNNNVRVCELSSQQINKVYM